MSGRIRVDAKLGSKQAIPQEVEQRLHDHILKLADLGFGIDWMDVRLLATKLATCAGVENFVAGGGWVDGFKAWYPDLARLRTGALERNRMGALNPDLIGSFFELLGESIDRVEELSGGSPITLDRILNVDEIGFTLNMPTGYVISRKSSRHAHAATGNSRDHVSVASTIRADGTYLPHFFILAGKRVKAEHTIDGRIRGTPVGSTFQLTAKGYMTDDGYDKYVDHLIRHQSNEEMPRFGHCWFAMATTATQCCLKS